MLDALIAAVAARNGFRASEYSVEWDGGDFEPGRAVHDLVIIAADGRRASTQLQDSGLRDLWNSVVPIEQAFKQLQRRARPRPW